MRSLLVRSRNHKDTVLTRLVQALNPLRYLSATAQAKAELAEREDLLQALLESLPECVKLVADDGRLLSMNPAGLAMIEADSFDQVKDQSIYPLVDKEHRAAFRALTARVFRGESGTLEFVVRGFKGTLRWLETKAVPFRSPSGEIVALLGVTRDITEQKRAEEALREREELFRLFVEHSPAAIAMFDTDMRYLAVSRRWLTDFGLGDQNLIGRAHYDVFPEIPERWKQVHQRCLAGAVERCEEDSFVRSDGRTEWVRWEVRPWMRACGDIGGIIIFTEVITERKETLAALRTAESRLRLALQAGRIGIWDWDMVTGAIVWSRGHEELWGLAPGSFQGSYEEFEARVHPEDREGLRRAVSQALAEHRTYRHEFRVIGPDGTVRWIAGQGEPSFDDAGKPVRMIGVVMDITERKAVEDELRRSHASLETAQERAHLGSWELDLTTQTGWWSREMFRLHGRDVSAGVPTFAEFLEMVHPEDRQGILDAHARLVRNGGSATLEYRTAPERGPSRVINASVDHVKDPEGRIVGLIGTNLDITERKRAEAALREHGERLQLLTQQLVRVQEEEARRIGRELHDDLGQLLTMLKIRLQTLPRREDGATLWGQVADLVAIVEQAIERVRTISSDLRPTILDDLGLTAALRWMLDRQAQEAGLKGSFSDCGIETRFPSELETTCFRVAQEALTNVVRHARAAHVRIELRQDGNELVLRVSDDGVGFDSEQALADISDGKNLGLLGMHERVALVSGRLSVRSVPGSGTEVIAHFPLPSKSVPAGGGP